MSNPKKKNRKKEYNKFFSYKNTTRNHGNFMYKNFYRSNSYNTRFTCSDFSFANFSKSTIKYCGFNGCKFNGTEFKNSNLRGCPFKGAQFNDVIFYNTKLSKSTFKNAQFNNVYFINTSIKDCSSISKDTPGIIFINHYSSKPPISSDLHEVIHDCNKNKFIYNSETLIFHKKKKLNYVNIMRLLYRFDEEQIIKGLKSATNNVKNDFFTLSYLVKIIDKIDK